MFKHLFKKSNFLPFILFITTLGLYLHNLSLSVYGGDVGDFVTTAYVGGVPHAPGYPLFTLIGHLFTLLPILTPAFRVGLISAFSGAASVLLFFLTLSQLTKKTFISFISASILATVYLFWFYSEIAEIFSFHIFFLTLLFYLATLYSFKKNARILFAFAITLGLAFTNHQTVILFVPSLLILLVPSWIKTKNRLKIAIIAIALSIIAFASIYLYVPIASSMHPPINWDNVHNINSFFRLLLRKDYGTFTAGSFTQPTMLQRGIILRSYLFIILTQLTIPVVAISLMGLVFLLRSKNLWAAALILAFLLSGPVFIGYAGFPLTGPFIFGVYERFFSMSALMILYAFPFGLVGLVNLFQKIFKRPIYGVLLQLTFCLIPVMLLIYNFPKTDMHNVWIGDNLGKDILSSLPKNTVLLMGGDTALFNTWYVHYALHYRPDVQIVNMNGFGDDPFMTKIQQEFRKANPKVKDPQDVVIQTLEFIARKRPVASATQLQGGKVRLTWVPLGLTFRLIPKNESMLTREEYLSQTEAIWQDFHLPIRNSSENLGNLTISEIPTIYSTALLDTGAHLETAYKDSVSAHLLYQKALIVDSDNAKAYAVLGLYELTTKKDCKAAISDLQNALDIDPSFPTSYFLLYSAYHDCAHDNANSINVVKKFDLLFNAYFFKEVKKSLDTNPTTPL